MKRWILVTLMMGILAGVATAGDVDFGARAGTMRMTEPDEGAGMVGSFLRFKLAEFLFLDTSIYYHTERLSEEERLELIPIQVSMMLFLLGNEGPVRPFLLAGGGVYWTRTTIMDISESEFDYGTHLGLGLDIALSDLMFIEADFRYVWLDVDTEGRTYADAAADYEHWIAGVALGFRLSR